MSEKWAFPGFKAPEPAEGRRVGLYSLRSRSLTLVIPAKAGISIASLRPKG